VKVRRDQVEFHYKLRFEIFTAVKFGTLGSDLFHVSTVANNQSVVIPPINPTISSSNALFYISKSCTAEGVLPCFALFNMTDNDDMISSSI
jgi:hypothetical protein